MKWTEVWQVGFSLGELVILARTVLLCHVKTRKWSVVVLVLYFDQILKLFRQICLKRGWSLSTSWAVERTIVMTDFSQSERGKKNLIKSFSSKCCIPSAVSCLVSVRACRGAVDKKTLWIPAGSSLKGSLCSFVMRCWDKGPHPLRRPLLEPWQGWPTPVDLNLGSHSLFK